MSDPQFIIVDTETTGINHLKDKIVELAACEVNGERRDYQTLVNPQMKIPYEAMAIHHITDEMAETGVPIAEAIADLVETFGYRYYVAHNAKFDRAFMQPHFSPIFQPVWICTMKCAQALYTEAPSYKNQVLRYYLGLKVETPPGLVAHRALYDCYVTRALFERMLQDAPIDSLLQWSNIAVKLKTIPFGKHKGTLFTEVDKGWLRWVLDKDDISEDVRHTARAELNRREGKML